ncbi:MAG: alpha-ketoglutarate-dependent dioxygenase AlkB [Pseudomonadota bacterium]|nr:alpha-ketoglutarate-dependent dioxygenase AlkB [Pseudomonadota bacterium]
MHDLFDTPLIAGLTTAGEFVTASQEQALIAAIDGQTLTPFQFHQWTGKRLTHSFGWSYDFQTGALTRAAAIPAWLCPYRDRAARFAGLAPDELVQALLIRYDPGAGIGWHKDRPIYDHVIGISLGAPATMRFRRAHNGRWLRAAAPLEPRAIYHLSGEVRGAWEHSILPMDRPRWSLTFRSFSAKGRQQAQATDRFPAALPL